MSHLDSRLHAFRPDLADVNLKGRVSAARYVQGAALEVVAPIAPLFGETSATARQTTQALLGERLAAFETTSEWVWGQLQRDGYVGYISRASVSAELTNPTHRVAVPLTFSYPQPDIKSQVPVTLPMNARLEIVESGEKFSKLSSGRYVFSRHLKPLHEAGPDFVAVAERFLDVPYLWGGKTAQGLDCSGLVQTALEACGISAPRDTDMQEAQLGRQQMINDLDALRRGDLVFWKGHVGIMADSKTLLHANGHHMLTVKEPLVDAVSRIAGVYGQPTSIKRL